ncbi:RNA-directed DNA polymerase [Ensifer sp. ENS09]|uniref:retron St85 family RNA-directed DNA polymerase n=1 Tax=Ensifer sp. ENS09 TaxID=2769263 RepID=UPI001782A27A|nr:retron St85 family RNA-directed DNA polymerase [Ensifer sp. ENS09]MBD9647294.1 RNA-directed DNA polymerase [Ensifer sp. ENS09]
MSEIIEKLVAASGLNPFVVRRILATAPRRYKEFSVPKRNGGKRKIAQPAKELKILQRAFVDEFLSELPIHPAATAYRAETSIKDNAERHAGFGPILKMDFKDFFPCITDRDWEHYCQRNNLFEDPLERRLSTLLLFHRPKGGSKLRLAIGAPSSPTLSNVLLFEFDRYISELVAPDKVLYTRYADDLTFSAPRTGHLTGVKRAVSRAINHVDFPTLRINREKTTYITTKFHRSVTGLTLANDGRVTIGRDKKREIRASVHRFTLGKLDEDSIERLHGYISFINSVEPEFIDVLTKKYGSGMMQNLRDASVAIRRA